MDPEEGDPDAVRETDQRGRHQRNQNRDGGVVGGHLRRHDERAHRGDDANR